MLTSEDIQVGKKFFCPAGTDWEGDMIVEVCKNKAGKWYLYSESMPEPKSPATDKIDDFLFILNDWNAQCMT